MHENVVDKRPSELRVFKSGNQSGMEGCRLTMFIKKKLNSWVEENSCLL